MTTRSGRHWRHASSVTTRASPAYLLTFFLFSIAELQHIPFSFLFSIYFFQLPLSPSLYPLQRELPLSSHFHSFSLQPQATPFLGEYSPSACPPTRPTHRGATTTPINPASAVAVPHPLARRPLLPGRPSIPMPLQHDVRPVAAEEGRRAMWPCAAFLS